MATIWMDGEFVPHRDAKVHVLTHALHYASSVFEGERAYGGVVFKSREHSQRLHTSARLLGFQLPYSVEEIDRAKAELIKKQGWEDCYLRAVAWRGSEQMGVSAQARRRSRRHRRLGVGRLLQGQDEGRAADDCAVAPPRARHRAVPIQGRRPLHGLHALAPRRDRRRLRRRHDVRLARPNRRRHRRQHLLRARRRAAHADAGLLLERHHPSNRDRACQESPASKSSNARSGRTNSRTSRKRS